ncbi:hypothetical protein GH741_19025 [Aquibacillus halophilus]|uniref:Spore coat protein YutH n=1 Tax=Aquibacillus halophilus TaxID=930132 RepID=A0A6A8DGE1_9BACI|nr:hypothetical protein [Aquibacillus halophilus]MRH44745.1 hypothetical protein [Aquibacillus halophilus]
MDELLSQYVPNFYGSRTTIDGFNGYINGDTGYFIIPEPNNEEVHYEQKVISDFLINSGVDNIATPLFSQQGQLTTRIDSKDYLVYMGRISRSSRTSSSAHTLASFHKLGTNYPYEPNYVSSYGQWKTLWASKVESFEQMYASLYQKRPVSSYHRLFIDTFPYLIGLSENAIQFLQESEADKRFHESDRPTITFQRYQHQLQKDIIWSHELVHDHPVRDLAEHIRPFLLEEDQAFFKIKTALKEYEQVQPLSVFSWRLLYARLLFPIHLFDFLESGLVRNEPENLYNEYKLKLEKQSNYERNLKRFFNEVGVDTRTLSIPVLDW